jgi:hypothetical protein
LGWFEEAFCADMTDARPSPPARSIVLARRWLCVTVLVVTGCAGIAEKTEHSSGYNWYHDWAVVGVPVRVEQMSIAPLYEVVRQRAGDSARKCSGPGIKWETALGCILQARADNVAAYVAFGNVGFDSLLGWGIASLPGGELELYRYDSSPCGGGDCPYALRMATCNRVAEMPPASEKPRNVCLDPEF